MASRQPGKDDDKRDDVMRGDDNRDEDKRDDDNRDEDKRDDDMRDDDKRDEDKRDDDMRDDDKRDEDKRDDDNRDDDNRDDDKRDDDKKDEKQEEPEPLPGPSWRSDSPIPSTSRADDNPSTSAEAARRLLESVLPLRRDSSTDSHSSEEELENINSRMNDPSASCGEGRCDLVSLNLRGDSAENSGDGGSADKRWSVGTGNRSRRSSKMNRSSHSSDSRSDPLSESSDEEIQDLLANIENNVEVGPPPPDNNNGPSDSRSPPTNAQNAERSEESAEPQAHASGQAQPQQQQQQRPPAAQIQRPYLDFEKMQQSSYSYDFFEDYYDDDDDDDEEEAQGTYSRSSPCRNCDNIIVDSFLQQKGEVGGQSCPLKVRTVTTWRYNDQGGGGELSLYCW